jgi:hypothetical protein
VKLDYLVKTTEKILEEEAESALRTCLRGIPVLKIAAVERVGDQAACHPDLVAEVETPAGKQTLLVEARQSGQPRITREAIDTLRRCRAAYPGAYGVVLAPYVSPLAAKICAEEEVGYLDLSGNCRLFFGGVYVEREGKPNRFTEKRLLRSLYSIRASRVVRVLLTHPRRAWTVSELASEADVSLGLAWKVKQLLLDREWTVADKGRVLLTKPVDLLSEWARNYSFRRNDAQDYYSMDPAATVEARLGALCSDRGIRYALTAFSAASRLAPAVRHQRTFAYVDNSAEEVAEELGLRKVATGANVTILKPYDAAVFYDSRPFNGSQIASPIQVYLDLVGFKGRGEEAAEAILREVIQPEW